MFNKILGILDNHNKKNILILFLLYFPLNFIEAFSITSIPGFVLLISEPEKIQEFLPEYNLSNLLTQLNLNERVTYGTVLIVLIFFFRAIIMIFVNWFDYTIRYKINVQNSKKLYSSYINKPYPETLIYASPNIASWFTKSPRFHWITANKCAKKCAAAVANT